MAYTSSNQSSSLSSSAFSKPCRGLIYRRSNDNVDQIAWWISACRAHS